MEDIIKIDLKAIGCEDVDEFILLRIRTSSGLL
jgi:hypothetical protein